MSNETSNIRSAHGTTTIAPGVLTTIARMAALGVPGVAGMAPLPRGVDRFFRRSFDQGVRIEVEENAVGVDLYLILAGEAKVREVCRKVQAEVARAIEEMVGMQVSWINVHVEDIDFNGVKS